MDINSRNDFYSVIHKEDIFEKFKFNLDGEDLSIKYFNSELITFQNCEFNCDILTISNIESDLFLEFIDCTFNCEVNFMFCKVDCIKFLNTKHIKALKISNGLSKKLKFEINNFIFKNDKFDEELKNSTNFSFNNVCFKQNFEFNNINNIDGILNFSNNIIGDDLYIDNKACVFNSSKISNVKFNDNEFNAYTSFKSSKFYFNNDNFNNTGEYWNESKFWNNKFNKVKFSEVEFDKVFKFDKCDFLSTTWFEKCKNIRNSHLVFIACEFNGFVLYNHSNLNFLDIDRCTFDKSVSFTDAVFNKIRLFEVKFGGGAYFDEIKINNVKDKSYLKDKSKILEWKRTLRAIKQELQKTENKIDFNRYRNYELAAHYKELKLNENFKDTTILWATKWSSNFGSWIWAFWFTILSGFFWYIVLYRIENSGVFDSEKANEFFVGLFRFFLVTDFYNPLTNSKDRIYLTTSLSWLVFILGKIFIAFGIYEMIQTFRKFKA
jgi:hypothetical protein